MPPCIQARPLFGRSCRYHCGAPSIRHTGLAQCLLVVICIRLIADKTFVLCLSVVNMYMHAYMHAGRQEEGGLLPGQAKAEQGFWLLWCATTTYCAAHQALPLDPPLPLAAKLARAGQGRTGPHGARSLRGTVPPARRPVCEASGRRMRQVQPSPHALPWRGLPRRRAMWLQWMRLLHAARLALP